MIRLPVLLTLLFIAPATVAQGWQASTQAVAHPAAGGRTVRTAPHPAPVTRPDDQPDDPATIADLALAAQAMNPPATRPAPTSAPRSTTGPAPPLTGGVRGKIADPGVTRRPIR